MKTTSDEKLKMGKTEISQAISIKITSPQHKILTHLQSLVFSHLRVDLQFNKNTFVFFCDDTDIT